MTQYRRPNIFVNETAAPYGHTPTMNVYQNTSQSVIFFDRQEEVSPITSPGTHISPHYKRTTELHPPLAPGDYIAVNVTGSATMSRIEEILSLHTCPATRVQGLSDAWPYWAYIEMAKLNNMRIHTTGIKRNHDRYACEIGEYLSQKLPQKDPVIVYAQDVVGLLWLGEVKDKYWTHVLWPELRRYAKNWNFSISYSKQDAYRGIDLKVYFIWNESHNVRMEPWDSMIRIINENDKYYVSDPRSRVGRTFSISTKKDIE